MNRCSLKRAQNYCFFLTYASVRLIFLHFYAFFLKFDIPSIENRHALKSQINALSAPFHISPARDYTREDKKKRPRKVASTRSAGTLHVAQQR